MNWDSIYRTILYPALVTILSIISPTKGVMVLLLILCTISFILGLWSSKIHHEESFSGKKFFKNFAELTSVIGLIASISLIGKIQGLGDESIQTASRAVGWAAIYGYVSVINKNLLRFFPGSVTFRFLDFILNVEFLKLNVLFEKFIKKEKKEKEEENS